MSFEHSTYGSVHKAWRATHVLFFCICLHFFWQWSILIKLPIFLIFLHFFPSSAGNNQGTEEIFGFHQIFPRRLFVRIILMLFFWPSKDFNFGTASLDCFCFKNVGSGRTTLAPHFSSMGLCAHQKLFQPTFLLTNAPNLG